MKPYLEGLHKMAHSGRLKSLSRELLGNISTGLKANYFVRVQALLFAFVEVLLTNNKFF